MNVPARQRRSSVPDISDPATFAMHLLGFLHD
jgi:hypothetical protein